MQTLEYDHTIHEKSNAGDDGLLVKFFIEAAPDSAESAKAGRPVFKDVEWVDIRIPGNRDNVVCRPAREKDKQRFPRHYAAFQQRIAGKEEKIVGTPLSAWPYEGLTPARVKELDFFNIRTVEQLASTSDNSGAKLPGFQAMKQAAKLYLETASKQAPVNAMNKRIVELEALVKRQETMIESLSDKLGMEVEEPAEKKRTVKRK